MRPRRSSSRRITLPDRQDRRCRTQKDCAPAARRPCRSPGCATRSWLRPRRMPRPVLAPHAEKLPHPVDGGLPDDEVTVGSRGRARVRRQGDGAEARCRGARPGAFPRRGGHGRFRGATGDVDRGGAVLGAQPRTAAHGETRWTGALSSPTSTPEFGSSAASTRGGCSRTRSARTTAAPSGARLALSAFDALVVGAAPHHGPAPARRSRTMHASHRQPDASVPRRSGVFALSFVVVPIGRRARRDSTVRRPPDR